jgi:hypothetical protein
VGFVGPGVGSVAEHRLVKAFQVERDVTHRLRWCRTGDGELVSELVSELDINGWTTSLDINGCCMR